MLTSNWRKNTARYQKVNFLHTNTPWPLFVKRYRHNNSFSLKSAKNAHQQGPYEFSPEFLRVQIRTGKSRASARPVTLTCGNCGKMLPPAIVGGGGGGGGVRVRRRSSPRHPSAMCFLRPCQHFWLPTLGGALPPVGAPPVFSILPSGDYYTPRNKVPS